MKGSALLPNLASPVQIFKRIFGKKLRQLLLTGALLLVSRPARAEFLHSDVFTYYGLVDAASSEAFVVLRVNSTFPPRKGFWIAHLSPLPGSIETLSLNDFTADRTNSMFVSLENGVTKEIYVNGVPYSRLRGPIEVELKGLSASLNVGIITQPGGGSYLSFYLSRPSNHSSDSILGAIGGQVVFNLSGAVASELRADLPDIGKMLHYRIGAERKLMAGERELAADTPLGVLVDSTPNKCLAKDAKITLPNGMSADSVVYLTSHLVPSTEGAATGRSYLVGVSFEDSLRVIKVQETGPKICVGEEIK